MELPGPGFVLRHWRTSDTRSLVAHASDSEVARGLGAGFPHPYTKEHAVGWLARQGELGEGSLDLAICVDGEAVGGIGCHQKSGVYSCKATIGYWLGRRLWGRGLATGALRTLTPHAFAERDDLWRLEATVYEWNRASCRVLEKAGFALEAKQRMGAVKDGVVLDTFLYAMLRE